MHALASDMSSLLHAAEADRMACRWPHTTPWIRKIVPLRRRATHARGRVPFPHRHAAEADRHTWITLGWLGTKSSGTDETQKHGPSQLDPGSSMPRPVTSARFGNHDLRETSTLTFHMRKAAHRWKHREGPSLERRSTR
eukprot:359827-Chlamydomonas_euryale.AAC.4